jgi:hypothetical protein
MEHVRRFYPVADTELSKRGVVVCVNDDRESFARVLPLVSSVHSPAVFKVIVLISQEQRPPRLDW